VNFFTEDPISDFRNCILVVWIVREFDCLLR
jgi:hypothetical protein